MYVTRWGQPFKRSRTLPALGIVQLRGKRRADSRAKL
jgi:hypothetical protein